MTPSTVGKLSYRHGAPPVILGCSGVGEVLEVAEDVQDVQPGDTVFCDPMVRPLMLSGAFGCLSGRLMSIQFWATCVLLCALIFLAGGAPK